MSTPWPLVALAVVLGLAIGSFLNVVIYRVPLGMSVVTPASACPRCDTPIRGRHNVPVLGWIVLRGRCAACALPISVRYPLVEAATGLLFGAVALRFGVAIELIAFLYLAAVAVALAMIDVDGHRLPDSLVLPSYVVALALLVPAGAVSADWHPVVRAVAGSALVLTLLMAASRARPHVIGPETVKLAGLAALYLAWLSWSALGIGLLGGALTILVVAHAGAPARAARTRAASPTVVTAVAVPVGACVLAATVLTVLTVPAV